MIPWDKIPEEYEYCAIDGGGRHRDVAWLFKNRPTLDGQGAWVAEGVLSSLRNFVDIKEVAGYLATHPQDSLIYRYDYEESTVMDSEHSKQSDRDSIREDIRKRLVKIKGIGPEKAERGSDAVMEYLDGLVSSQQENPCKLIPGMRDEDGILMMKRPEGVPDAFNYLYWSPSHRKMVWLNPEKVETLYPDCDHYSCGEKRGERPLFVDTSHEYMYEILEQLPACPVEDRIRRLVD